MSLESDALLDIAEAIRELAQALNRIPINYNDRGAGAIVLHCENFHHFESHLNVQADVTQDE